MVRTTMAIEREISDAKSIWDVGARGKWKENQPSSSTRKEPSTSTLQ